MEFRSAQLKQLAEMICGNRGYAKAFAYRSSSLLTDFFQDCDLEFVHQGETRHTWVADVLKEVLAGPQPDPYLPPAAFAAIIDRLLLSDDATPEDPSRELALAELNKTLGRQGLEAFAGGDGHHYLRNIETQRVATELNPHRALSKRELKKRDDLARYLDRVTEDQLTEEVLLPMFRHLGFQRVSSAGHKDKALEYGKDMWMRFRLPTLHYLYFGVQVKKGKLDAAGRSRSETANVAEVLAQLRMMFDHPVFDTETNKRNLVDHGFIIAGSEITKAARNWLGENLSASQRSQVLFMDRNDILDLFVVANLPLPAGAEPAQTLDDEIPF